MNIFLSELLEHWRAGGVTLPEVVQQLRMLGGDRIDYREELRQAASCGELDEAVAQQLIFALTSEGQSAQPADQAAPTLLRTISAHAPESITLVPAGEAVSAVRMGTGSTPNSHPKTEIARDRLKAAFGGTHAASALSGEPLRLVPGSMVKQRFILKERIGHGGMGVVFSAIDRRKTEARDPNPLVAIKILDSELARYDKAWMALQREARKAQTLAHPNVVTVFDFDRDGDTAFMTMELLEGRSLEGFVRDARKLPPKPADIWPIIRGMAEGLAYAHRNGIVHSDLKPGNVFVTTNNVVKILDFGIARAVPAFTATQKVQDTFDAVALGAYTATYATAEMMQGGEPHASDDVYGLALIAYELFTGAHPYKRLSAVEAQQQNLRPAPIKNLSRRQWRVLERSLRFERNQRPQDAGEFLRELISLTRAQYITIATMAVLATTAIFLGYQNYIEAGPSIAFAQLPPDTQQQFTAYMRAGDDLWRFYQQDHNLLALQEAIDQYGHAFAVHPRNRDATHALERAADAGLKDLAAQPAEQLALAKALAERSDYLAKYAPIRELVQ